MSMYNIVASTNECNVVMEYVPVEKRSDAYQSEAALEKEFIRCVHNPVSYHGPIVRNIQGDMIMTGLPDNSTVEPKKRLRECFSTSLICQEEGYALAFWDVVSTLKDETFKTDLVFFNYILDAFILVDFLGYEPDANDQERMISAIDAFNRRYRPKGKNQTLGILIGHDGSTFHITPAMKFNQKNIKVFYGTYQERIDDFAVAVNELVDGLTSEEIFAGMGISER